MFPASAIGQKKNDLKPVAMSLPFKINPALDTLPVYQPGRPLEEVAREIGLPVENITKLASNENPLGPAPTALAALRLALAQQHLYPDGNAYYLKQELSARLNIAAQQLIVGNGSNEIIEFVAHALLDSDAEVVVSQYCFAVYPIVTHLFGAKLITVPARDYGHDLPAMLNAVTDNTRILFVANPNNPTGTLAPEQDVLNLIRDLPPHVVLVMDEAYIEFLEDAVDLLPNLRAATSPNLILMRTFSKIHGLAGLRVGYGIGHPDFIAALEKVRQPFNLNALAQTAALAALRDESHQIRTRANNDNGKQYLTRSCTELGLNYVPSHANFLLLEVAQGQVVFDALLQHGIVTRPMGGYGLPEWIRVSIGTPDQNAKFISHLRECLATLTDRPQQA